jgi:hypothetical protein
MNYNIDYFIAKFKAIPEDQMGDSQDTGCAYGQCRKSHRVRDDGSATQEGIALTKLMASINGLTASSKACYDPYLGTPARINNGEVEQYQQPTPKQRILAALLDIKNAEENKMVVERIVYVVVDKATRELSKQLCEH